MDQSENITERTYLTREVAQQLHLQLSKLQQYIGEGLISAPPKKDRKGDPRFGALAGGQFRPWTESNVQLAHSQLADIRLRNEPPPNLYSTKQVAERLRMSPTTLRKWIAEKKIDGPSVMAKGVQLPRSNRTWPTILLWTEADIAKVTRKPNAYHKTTPAERKRRAAKQYQRDYMNARYATDPEAGRKQVQTSRAKRKTEFAELQTLKSKISKGRPRNNADRRRVLELRSEGCSWGEIRIQMNRETGQNKTAGAYRYLAESI